jgi:hypothetical protein
MAVFVLDKQSFHDSPQGSSWGEHQPLRLKRDPGSRITGLARVREAEAATQTVLWLAELQHRGTQIRNALSQRRAFRRRRGANLRYRAPRFEICLFPTTQDSTEQNGGCESGRLKAGAIPPQPEGQGFLA